MTSWNPLQGPVSYTHLLLTVRTPKIFDDGEASAQAAEDDGYYEKASSGGNGGFEGIFGKFSQACTGKAQGGGFKKPSGRKKTFDDRNIKTLISIAEKQMCIRDRSSAF